QLTTFSSIQKPENFNAIPDSIHQLSAGIAMLEIAFDNQEIRFFLPFSQAGNIATETTPTLKLSSITPRDIKKTVSANVSLSLGQHMLSDINALEPGDILVSTTPLNMLFTVQLGNKKIADANLGSKETKKAILLVTPGK